MVARPWFYFYQRPQMVLTEREGEREELKERKVGGD